MSERYPGELANLRTAERLALGDIQRNEVKIRDHVASARRLRSKRADLRQTLRTITDKIKEAEQP